MIWLGVALILFFTKTYFTWPNAESAKIAIPLVLAIGLLPLLLLMPEHIEKTERTYREIFRRATTITKQVEEGHVD